MEIVLKGQHNGKEMLASLDEVIRILKSNYHIGAFNEIHLSVTLLNEKGQEVELVDSETNQAYRVFEVYRQGFELNGRRGFPKLHLVVDNT